MSVLDEARIIRNADKWSIHVTYTSGEIVRGTYTAEDEAIAAVNRLVEAEQERVRFKPVNRIEIIREGSSWTVLTEDDRGNESNAERCTLTEIALWLTGSSTKISLPPINP